MDLVHNVLLSYISMNTLYDDMEILHGENKYGVKYVPVYGCTGGGGGAVWAAGGAGVVVAGAAAGGGDSGAASPPDPVSTEGCRVT